MNEEKKKQDLTGFEWTTCPFHLKWLLKQPKKSKYFCYSWLIKCYFN